MSCLSLLPPPHSDPTQSRTDAGTVTEQIAGWGYLFPESDALSKHGATVTYGELNRRADLFASYLAECGVESGGTVAICMERSFEWIIAALGIMRAGAAYVPIEPSWPDHRVCYAVKDSGASALVSRAVRSAQLGLKIPCIDPWRDAAAIAASSLSTGRIVTTDSLAYLIYTSGTTGVPKGVEITHANLANVIRWYRETFQVTPQDRASHLMGLGFDATVLEIWGHLCAGATLCLSDEGERASPESIHAWINREGVTIALLPAILGERLTDMEWPEDSELRTLIVGGDVLHHGPPAGLPFRVANHYGPTECTVVSTCAMLSPGTDADLPPIGCPIDGATVYLLDEQGEHVADGTVGEIYIAGSGLGRGYRNLPELTERSFLPDPFSGVEGSRMYRTGDLGRRRADGQLDFCGRCDRQVKIRGQRVELDEIGNVLMQRADIAFAVAIQRDCDAGGNNLVAYLQLSDDAPVPAVQELQEFLLESLPDYMIPSSFMRLRTIPLSANGKLDLAMLPCQPDLLVLTNTQEAPATPLEEKLVIMVREVLENHAVGVDDNFFLVGGHSLLGMQLVMRLRKSFGADVTLQQLFEAPTVRRLALTVEQMIIERIDAMTDDEARTELTS